jgi:hypothetical protein
MNEFQEENACCLHSPGGVDKISRMGYSLIYTFARKFSKRIDDIENMLRESYLERKIVGVGVSR